MLSTSFYRDISSQTPAWEPFRQRWDHVAMSSRIRLARNLRGRPFPERLGAEELEGVADCFLEGARKHECVFAGGTAGKMRFMEPMDRDLLVERRLISPVLRQGGAGRAYIAGRHHQMALLINEEDHVRIQCIMPGADLKGPWELAAAIEADLSERHDFAFDPTLGYLTACPSNLGTGLRASVMLHLPGLVLAGLIGPVAKGLNAIGYAVRGAFGEGSDGIADCYQVSNHSCLGEAEEDIITALSERISEVIQHELNARRRLATAERCRLYDHVGRAYGIVRHSRLLTTEEALNGVSALVTGVRCGILRNVGMDVLNRLFLDVQPGHLQGFAGKALDSRQRDELRARLARETLGGS